MYNLTASTPKQGYGSMWTEVASRRVAMTLPVLLFPFWKKVVVDYPSITGIIL